MAAAANSSRMGWLASTCQMICAALVVRRSCVVHKRYSTYSWQWATGESRGNDVFRVR
jgi:hypothetical protein